jgi:hypothetical protein
MEVLKQIIPRALSSNDGYHASLTGNYLAGCIPEDMHPGAAKQLGNVAAKETKKQAIHTLQ